MPRISWSELREKYELEALWERRFHRLSGGEKARALLAMSMVRQPRLLLADEPSASLDVGHAWRLLQRLRAERSRTTVLLVLHDLNLALAVADEVWVLDGGKLVAEGKAEAVFRSPVVDRVFRQAFHRHVCGGRLVLVPLPQEAENGACDFSRLD